MFESNSHPRFSLALETHFFFGGGSNMSNPRHGCSEAIPLSPIPSFPESIGRFATRILLMKSKWQSAGQEVGRNKL